jgi:hypothetical protein
LRHFLLLDTSFCSLATRSSIESITTVQLVNNARCRYS